MQTPQQRADELLALWRKQRAAGRSPEARLDHNGDEVMHKQEEQTYSLIKPADLAALTTHARVMRDQLAECMERRAQDGARQAAYDDTLRQLLALHKGNPGAGFADELVAFVMCALEKGR